MPNARVVRIDEFGRFENPTDRREVPKLPLINFGDCPHGKIPALRRTPFQINVA